MRKGISLVVQWLRLCTSTAEGGGSIPGWRTGHGAAKKKRVGRSKWTFLQRRHTDGQKAHEKMLTSLIIGLPWWLRQ